MGVYDLTTLEKVKEHLQIPVATTSEDSYLERMIEVATSRIEKSTDRKLKKRSIIEFRDGRSNDRLLLRQWPVVAITELWIDTSSQFTDSNLILASDRYALDGAEDNAVGVILLPGRRFPKVRRSIKIVYEAGFDTIPADLEDLAIWVVDWLYDMRSDRRVGTASKGKNQENTSFLGDLPDFHLETLNSYKRVEFPGADIGVGGT